MATNIIPFTNSTANAILRKPLFDDLIDEPEHDEPITHLHSILKKHMRETDEITEKEEQNKIARRITCGIFMLFYLPTIICNLYYLSNDDSCITNTNPDFKLNLYDFLYVDAMASITVIFVIIIDVLYNPKNNILEQLAIAEAEYLLYSVARKADSTTQTTATFTNNSIKLPPTGSNLPVPTVQNFQFYANGISIPQPSIISFAQTGSDMLLTIEATGSNGLGYYIDGKEIMAIGKLLN